MARLVSGCEPQARRAAVLTITAPKEGERCYAYSSSS